MCLPAGLGEILLIFQLFPFVVDYFSKVNYDCVFVVSDTGVQMNAGIGQLSNRSLRGQVVFSFAKMAAPGGRTVRF